MIYEQVVIEIDNFKAYNKVTLSEMQDACHIFWESASANNRPVYYSNVGSGMPNTSDELYKALLTPVNLKCVTWNQDNRNYAEEDLITDPTLDRLPTSVGFEDTKAERLVENHLRYLSERYRADLDFGDDYYADVNFNHEQNVEFLKKIKTGINGVVYFDVEGIYKITLDADSVIASSDPIEVKGYIKLYNPYENETKNILATKTPFISDLPKTKGGTKFSGRNSFNNHLESGFGNIFPPDTEIDPKLDLNNYKAGFLELSYNHNTGKFESGTTQLLARTLEAIGPCSTPGFEIDNPTNDPVLMYTKDFEENQIGDFDLEENTGKAVVLSVQKGNPYLFGPNFLRKSEFTTDDEIKSVEKETILVVNRTNATFDQNELIMCSRIDGEWIPQKFAEGGGGSTFAFQIENWSFQKVISDSDSYFRDKRYYDNIDSPDFDPSSRVNLQTDPESYEITMRGRFYKDLYSLSSTAINNIPGIAALNFVPQIEQTVAEALTAAPGFISTEANWDFLPSERYWQVTAFDQMGEFAGGKNEKNIIARTNHASAPDGLPDDEFPLPNLWIEWWGPSFIDGYRTVDVQGLLSKKENLLMRANGLNSNEYFFLPGNDGFDASSNNPAIVDVGTIGSAALDRNWSKNYSSPQGMFGNPTDRIGLNIPAEVATNSPPQEGSVCSPLEDLKILIQNYGCSTGNLLDATNNILEVDPNTGVQYRFNWIYNLDTSSPTSGVFDPVYALQPNVPNRIDFFSLPAEVVSSTDYDRSTAGENVTRNYANFELMTEHLTTPKYPDHLLGSDFLFDRNSHCSLDHFTKAFTNNGSSIKVIPHDKYVKRRSTGNVGGLLQPTIWDEDTADCIGVIASKCKIKFKGSELRFIVDQDFGLKAQISFTLGQSPSVSILPIGGGLVLSAGGTNSSQRTNERWGQANDRPQDFHTTALHMRLFDQWPDDQTIYDPRYYGVFHFNPGKILSDVAIDEEIELLKLDGTTVYNPDKIDTKVDFRIPTDGNNDPVPLNTPFFSDLVMAEPKYWRVNPIRRGMMLNNGGFKYLKRYSGIADGLWNDTANDLGTGYAVGDILTTLGGSGKGVQIEVTGVGSNGELNPDNLIILNRGTGFLSSDFASSSDLSASKVKLTGGSGSGANIFVTSGIIYEKIEYDAHPKSRSGIIRLTEGNNRGLGNKGTGPVEGFHEKSFILSEANSEGKYDIFFYYHNDISHTLCSVDDYFYSPVQRVLLEINAV